MTFTSTHQAISWPHGQWERTKKPSSIEKNNHEHKTCPVKQVLWLASLIVIAHRKELPFESGIACCANYFTTQRISNQPEVNTKLQWILGCFSSWTFPKCHISRVVKLIPENRKFAGWSWQFKSCCATLFTLVDGLQLYRYWKIKMFKP